MAIKKFLDCLSHYNQNLSTKENRFVYEEQPSVTFIQSAPGTKVKPREVPSDTNEMDSEEFQAYLKKNNIAEIKDDTCTFNMDNQEKSFPWMTAFEDSLKPLNDPKKIKAKIIEEFSRREREKANQAPAQKLETPPIDKAATEKGKKAAEEGKNAENKGLELARQGKVAETAPGSRTITLPNGRTFNGNLNTYIGTVSFQDTDKTPVEQAGKFNKDTGILETGTMKFGSEQIQTGIFDKKTGGLKTGTIMFMGGTTNTGTFNEATGTMTAGTISQDTTITFTGTFKGDGNPDKGDFTQRPIELATSAKAPAAAPTAPTAPAAPTAPTAPTAQAAPPAQAPAAPAPATPEVSLLLGTTIKLGKIKETLLKNILSAKNSGEILAEILKAEKEATSLLKKLPLVEAQPYPIHELKMDFTKEKGEEPTQAEKQAIINDAIEYKKTKQGETSQDFSAFLETEKTYQASLKQTPAQAPAAPQAQAPAAPAAQAAAPAATAAPTTETPAPAPKAPPEFPASQAAKEAIASTQKGTEATTKAQTATETGKQTADVADKARREGILACSEQNAIKKQFKEKAFTGKEVEGILIGEMKYPNGMKRKSEIGKFNPNTGAISEGVVIHIGPIDTGKFDQNGSLIEGTKELINEETQTGKFNPETGFLIEGTSEGNPVQTGKFKGEKNKEDVIAGTTVYTLNDGQKISFIGEIKEDNFFYGTMKTNAGTYQIATKNVTQNNVYTGRFTRIDGQVEEGSWDKDFNPIGAPEVIAQATQAPAAPTAPAAAPAAAPKAAPAQQETLEPIPESQAVTNAIRTADAAAKVAAEASGKAQTA
ncbi:MAG: hypothetical protein WC651_04515, partial [Candidatus Gracilibacteria bacterium]